jgi:hypothetical protein
VTYPDSFFDALGRWQRGWKRDPVLRGSLARNLVRETKRLPDALRRNDGRALYRKRNLYRSEDQAELFPLFMQGVLDEGSPTSWSTDLGFAERFGKIFDDHSPNSVAGAIFRHVPADDEVVLNIPRLWLDPDFVASANSYRRRSGLGRVLINPIKPKQAVRSALRSGHGQFAPACPKSANTGSRHSGSTVLG